MEIVQSFVNLLLINVTITIGYTIIVLITIIDPYLIIFHSECFII